MVAKLDQAKTLTGVKNLFIQAITKYFHLPFHEHQISNIN